MDSERYIEQILGNENLTDALDDDDASWLLDWGIAKLDAVLQEITDRSDADRRASAVMAVMRKMNTIVGSYAKKDPSDLSLDLADLHDLFTAAFAPTAPPHKPDFKAAAASLSKCSSRKILEYFAGDFFHNK